MPDLRYKELFWALFLAFVVAYFSVWLAGMILTKLTALLIGAAALATGGWLFYGFRRKLSILRQVFIEELPSKTGQFFSVFKVLLWDNNGTKFYSLVFSIICFLVIIIGINSEGEWLGTITSIQVFYVKMISIFLSVFIPIWTIFCLLLPSELGIIGRAITNSPKFFFWLLPKFILKVIILTVRKVHSRELVTTVIYALLGMLHIIIFPPFNMTVEMVFIMSIAGGVFTGGCGCLIHKVLSTAAAQRVFVKVEAW